MIRSEKLPPTVLFKILAFICCLVLFQSAAFSVSVEEQTINKGAKKTENNLTLTQQTVEKNNTDHPIAELSTNIIDNAEPSAVKSDLDLLHYRSEVLDHTVNYYVATIEQIEAETGPYDDKLAEIVYSLGRTLQNAHRYNDAVTSYKRSLYLNRINYGIYSVSQAPMLRGIVECQIAQGQTKDAAENYEQLLWIHLKSYGEDDPRLISLLNEISQWHLKAYIQNQQRTDGYHLSAAFDLYSIAINLSIKNYGEYNTGLISLLNNIAITGYYQSLHQQRYPEYAELGASVPFGYRAFGTQGKERLNRGSYYLQSLSARRRILDILNKNSDITATQRAQIHTDEGDWYLLYGRYDLAIKSYQQAHQDMQGEEEQQQQQVISALFGSPAMLPILKPFVTTEGVQKMNQPDDATKNLPPLLSHSDELKNKMSNPLTQEVYVNLAMDITPAGSATNYQVEGVYPNTDNSSKLILRAKETLYKKKFRPRFEAGQPVLTNAYPMKVVIPDENT